MRGSSPDTTPTSQTSGRIWPAVLAVLGSSGFIAVFCLLTGEMYWDGYLSAFGLTPDEFPASASNVRTYAYAAAVTGLGSVVLAVLKYGLWVVAGYIVLAALIPLADLPRFKAPLQSARGALADSLQRTSTLGFVARMVLSAVVVAGAFAAVAYLGLCLVLASAGPAKAHQLGKEHGKAALDRLRSLTGTESEACSRMKTGALSGKCLAPIAFSDKSVAVISGNRIHRVPRESFDMDSPAGRADQPDKPSATASAPK